MAIEDIRNLKKKAAAKKNGVPGKYRSRKRTKKYAKTMRQLSINYDPYLEKHPVCAIQSPICTYRATCVNHKAGRGVNEVLDQSTWEPSCDPCNLYIEGHDAWAREHGHKVSRLTNRNK
jgi:hypothetical protein